MFHTSHECFVLGRPHREHIFRIGKPHERRWLVMAFHYWHVRVWLGCRPFVWQRMTTRDAMQAIGSYLIGACALAFIVAAWWLALFGH